MIIHVEENNDLSPEEVEELIEEAGLIGKKAKVFLLRDLEGAYYDAKIIAPNKKTARGIAKEIMYFIDSVGEGSVVELTNATPNTLTIKICEGLELLDEKIIHFSEYFN